MSYLFLNLLQLRKNKRINFFNVSSTASGAHAFRNSCPDTTPQIISSKGDVRQNPIDLLVVVVWVRTKEQHLKKLLACQLLCRTA